MTLYANFLSTGALTSSHKWPDLLKNFSGMWPSASLAPCGAPSSQDLALVSLSPASHFWRMVVVGYGEPAQYGL